MKGFTLPFFFALRDDAGMAHEDAQFTGFDDWVEVFRGGVQTDSGGTTRQWTAADLDSIVANHAPDDAAPAVIGHPRNDSPAYGWVSALKRAGDTLLAKFTDVHPEFEAGVKSGAYRKRSIALDRAGDGFRLRHVGWLGAAAPAIPGLKTVAFQEAAPDFQFEADFITPNTLARMLRNLREFFIDKFDLETADRYAPEFQVESMQDHANAQRSEPGGEDNPNFSQPAGSAVGGGSSNREDTMINDTTTFTQADLDAARDEGRNELAGENEALSKRLAEERRERARAEFSSVLNKAIDEQRLKPAQCEGLMEFRLALADDSPTFEFTRGSGESAVKISRTPAQMLVEFIGSLGKQLNITTESDAASDLGPTAHEFEAPTGFVVDQDRNALHAKALHYQKEHPGVEYLDAYKAVGGE